MVPPFRWYNIFQSMFRPNGGQPKEQHFMGKPTGGENQPGKKKSRNPTVTLVIIAHSGLNSRPDLEDWFRPQNGFVVVRSSADDKLRSYAHDMIPTVILADEQTFVGAISNSPSRGESKLALTLVLGPDPVEATKVKDMILAGAMGYLPENSSPATIRKAVHCVATGEMWASRNILSLVITEMLHSTRPTQLTSREQNVLQCVHDGLINRQIAEKLGISHETVRWHLRRIYAKSGLRPRREGVSRLDSEELDPEPALPAVSGPADRNAG